MPLFCISSRSDVAAPDFDSRSEPIIYTITVVPTGSYFFSVDDCFAAFEQLQSVSTAINKIAISLFFTLITPIYFMITQKAPLFNKKPTLARGFLSNYFIIKIVK